MWSSSLTLFLLIRQQLKNHFTCKQTFPVLHLHFPSSIVSFPSACNHVIIFQILRHNNPLLPPPATSSLPLVAGALEKLVYTCCCWFFVNCSLSLLIPTILPKQILSWSAMVSLQLNPHLTWDAGDRSLCLLRALGFTWLPALYTFLVHLWPQWQFLLTLCSWFSLNCPSS